MEKSLELIWLDNNSWLITIAGKNILLDPWLVGDLVFGNLPWLFQGKKSINFPIPQQIDLILLSQGLEDHAHPPTLETLNHQIPVVASPNAAKVVEKLGYNQVIALAPGENYTLDNCLEIKAFPGSSIGPQIIENAYLLKALASHQTLYYEPHGFHSPTLKNYAPVDVVITPIIELSLLNLVPIIKGYKTALEVCQWLQPQVVLPTAAGGNIEYEGLISGIIRESGSIEQFRALLAENQLKTQVITPKPGENVKINSLSSLF